MTVMEISGRTPVLMERLLMVWERSVRATHAFLSQEEILRIRQYVPEALTRAPSERGRRRAPPGPRRRLVGCKVFVKAAQAVPKRNRLCFSMALRQGAAVRTKSCRGQRPISAM